MRLSLNKPAVILFLTGDDGVIRAPQAKLTMLNKKVYVTERFAPSCEKGVFKVDYSERGAAVLDLTKEIHSPFTQHLLNSHDNPYFEVVRTSLGARLTPFKINVKLGTKHGPPRLMPSARLWSDSLQLGRNKNNLTDKDVLDLFETLLAQVYNVKKSGSIIGDMPSDDESVQNMLKIEDMFCRLMPNSAKARILSTVLHSIKDDKIG